MLFNSRCKQVFAFGICFVLSFGLICGCSDNSGDKTPPREQINKTGVKAKKIKTTASKLGKKRKAALPVRDEKKKSLDKMNEKLLLRLTQHAVDKDDLKSLSKYAVRARNSEDPAKRALVVEALGHFHAKGIPELMMFINDDDPDVSTAAIRLVDTYFDDIGTDYLKANMVEVTLPYLTDGMVDSFVSKFDNLSKEIAVPKIMSLMDQYADDELVKSALLREYEFVTGVPFTKKSEGYKWVRENMKTSP